ncbi:MAG: CBS domain-containing protein [Promethearchaeota archaeon]
MIEGKKGGLERTAPIEDTACAKVMSKPVIFVHADDSVKEAVRQMARYRLSMVVVVDEAAGDALEKYNVITHGDLVRFMADNDANVTTLRARDLMNGPLVYIRLNDTIEDAVRELTGHGIKRLVVLDDDDELAGVVSTKDLYQLDSSLFQPATMFALVVLDKGSSVPLFSYTFPGAPEGLFEDLDLFGGTLAVMQDLISEVLNAGGELREIRKENYSILIQRGFHVTTVLVVDHASIGKRKRLQRFVKAFEERFDELLVEFEGLHPPPVTDFESAAELVDYFFLDIGDLRELN